MRPAMEHPELVPRLREMAAANGGNWMGLLRHGDSRTRRRSPRAPSHAMLRAPTLLVVGTQDVPDIQPSPTPQRHVRGLRREAFEGRHLVNMEQPQRFTAWCATSAPVSGALVNVGSHTRRQFDPRWPVCVPGAHITRYASRSARTAIPCPFLSYPWQDAHARVHSGTGHLYQRGRSYGLQGLFARARSGRLVARRVWDRQVTHL